MRDFALFIGWGGTHPGREARALEHFAEWEEILARQRAEGMIEGFETVLLGSHGGELDGFTLVDGKPEALAALQVHEDVLALQARAVLDHTKLCVIPARTGPGVAEQFERYEEALAEYEREPAFA